MRSRRHSAPMRRHAGVFKRQGSSSRHGQHRQSAKPVGVRVPIFRNLNGNAAGVLIGVAHDGGKAGDAWHFGILAEIQADLSRNGGGIGDAERNRLNPIVARIGIGLAIAVIAKWNVIPAISGIVCGIENGLDGKPLPGYQIERIFFGRHGPGKGLGNVCGNGINGNPNSFLAIGFPSGGAEPNAKFPIGRIGSEDGVGAVSKCNEACAITRRERLCLSLRRRNGINIGEIEGDFNRARGEILIRGYG